MKNMEIGNSIPSQTKIHTKNLFLTNFYNI